MYANDDVNQELRERLPRAGKSDPFKCEVRELSESDISEIEEQIVVEEETSAATRWATQTFLFHSYDNTLWLWVKDVSTVNIVVINFLCNLYHISGYVFMELY